MGAEGIVIGVIILLVVVAFYGTQLTDFYKGISDQIAIQNANLAIKNANTATDKATTLPPPKVGQQVCSLKVVFNPQLTQLTAIAISSSIHVQLDGGAKSISWYSCHTTTPSLAMLIPMLNPSFVNGLTEFDLTFNNKPSPAGYKFSATLVADDGTQTHPIVNPAPAVGLNPQTKADGQKFTITYVFQDIPRQHYILQMSSSDIGINQGGGSVGNIYYQDIPK